MKNIFLPTTFAFIAFLIIILPGCKKNDDKDPVYELATVSTLQVTSITDVSCITGGSVTSGGGLQVTARGVCWSELPDPDILDSKTSNGSGTGSFTSTVDGLTANTTYYLRAYATNSKGTAYGNQLSFTTQSGSGGAVPCPGIPTVVFEGKIYHTILVDEQCWIRENMDVGVMINGMIEQSDNGVIEKYCLDNDTINCNFYGGLYMWDEMMQYVTTEGSQGICPPGWHVATDTEFKILQGTADTQYDYPDPVWDGADYMGFDVGKNLKAEAGWSPGGNGIDLYGFRALPGGTRDGTGVFGGDTLFAYFHTATQADLYNSWGRKLAYGSTGILRNYSLKENGYSVRCIKD